MSAKEEFDPALLETLTEEERAAITGGDPYDVEALKALAEDSGDEGEDDDDEGDDESTNDAPPTVPPADEAQAVEPATKTRVAYDYKLPDDYTAKVEALREQEDALAQQFKSGDLDFDAYRAEARKIDQEREALTDMRVKAAISEELNQQTGEAEWFAALRVFNSTTAKADGIDYAKDMDKQADFDLFLKSLAEKPENASKDMQWYITEAHKRVKALHGVVAPTKPAKQTRQPNLEGLPKTLVDVPGADGPGDVSDEFAGLDSLDGLAFEDALANLKRSNPAAFARYESR